LADESEGDDKTWDMRSDERKDLSVVCRMGELISVSKKE